jgi:hypothetical protein
MRICPFLGPRGVLVLALTHSTPILSHREQVGRCLSQRSLRARHSSQARPGCWRVRPEGVEDVSGASLLVFMMVCAMMCVPDEPILRPHRRPRCCSYIWTLVSTTPSTYLKLWSTLVRFRACRLKDLIPVGKECRSGSARRVDPSRVKHGQRSTEGTGHGRRRGWLNEATTLQHKPPWQSQPTRLVFPPNHLQGMLCRIR